MHQKGNGEEMKNMRGNNIRQLHEPTGGVERTPNETKGSGSA